MVKDVISAVEHEQHRQGPAELTPGYFAGVMGTGIVSIGAALIGLEVISTVLFWCTVVFYVGAPTR